MRREKVVVLYDGWCPLCRKSVKNLKRFDTCNAISYKSFRDVENTKDYNVDISLLESRMHAFDKNKKAKQGIDAFILIIRYMPLLWLTLPLLIIAQKFGFGQKVYDYIANNRKIVPVGQCDTNSCNLPINIPRNGNSD